LTRYGRRTKALSRRGNRCRTAARRALSAGLSITQRITREYGLALEEIAGTLAQDAIAITGQERGDMLTLAARMNLDGDLVPRALAACPQTADLKHR